jgi:hypothetical protein
MIEFSVFAIMYLYCDTVKSPLTVLWRLLMPDGQPWLTINRHV